MSSPRLPGISCPHWKGMSFLELSLTGSLPSCKNLFFTKTFRIKPKSLAQARGPSQWFLADSFLGLISHCSPLTLCTLPTGRGFSSVNTPYAFSPLHGLSCLSSFPICLSAPVLIDPPDDFPSALPTVLYNHAFTVCLSQQTKSSLSMSDVPSTYSGT